MWKILKDFITLAVVLFLTGLFITGYILLLLSMLL